jgi:SAM-dependent methyltransferase
MFAHPLAQANLKRYSSLGENLEPLTSHSTEVQRGLDKLPDYAKIETVLKGLVPERGFLVEIGSYSGLLLDFFRQRGWKVLGVEPDSRAAMYARTNYAIDVCEGTIDAVDLPSGHVDAVVMLHVIEHVDDPASVVTKVHRLLGVNGVFVVETPRYDSLSFRLLGRRERSIACDGHIYFYTIDTLGKLLCNAGFEVIRIDKVGRTMSIARLLWNIGVISKSERVLNFFQVFSKKFNLDRRHIYLNAYDMVRIYAKKIHS